MLIIFSSLELHLVTSNYELLSNYNFEIKIWLHHINIIVNQWMILKVKSSLLILIIELGKKINM